MDIISPHNIESKKVTEKDLERVYTDASKMLKMCFERKGLMGGAYAIAHPQVQDWKPLRFFVTKEGKIICNPKILKHTKTTVDSEEHCLTFFYKKESAIIQRWNVIEVEHEELINEKLVKKHEKITGLKAKIYQHELDHLNCKYIYAIDLKGFMKEKEADEKIKKLKEEAKDVEPEEKVDIVPQSVEILQ